MNGSYGLALLLCHGRQDTNRSIALGKYDWDCIYALYISLYVPLPVQVQLGKYSSFNCRFIYQSKHHGVCQELQEYISFNDKEGTNEVIKDVKDQPLGVRGVMMLLGGGYRCGKRHKCLVPGIMHL